MQTIITDLEGCLKAVEALGREVKALRQQRDDARSSFAMLAASFEPESEIAQSCKRLQEAWAI